MENQWIWRKISEFGPAWQTGPWRTHITIPFRTQDLIEMPEGKWRNKEQPLLQNDAFISPGSNLRIIPRTCSISTGCTAPTQNGCSVYVLAPVTAATRSWIWAALTMTDFQLSLLCSSCSFSRLLPLSFSFFFFWCRSTKQINYMYVQVMYLLDTVTYIGIIFSFTLILCFGPIVYSNILLNWYHSSFFRLSITKVH